MGWEHVMVTPIVGNPANEFIKTGEKMVQTKYGSAQIIKKYEGVSAP